MHVGNSMSVKLLKGTLSEMIDNDIYVAVFFTPTRYPGRPHLAGESYM